MSYIQWVELELEVVCRGAGTNRRTLLVEALVRVTYRMKAWAKAGERKR